VRVDASEIKDPRELARKIAGMGPGTAVALSIIRDGNEQTINLKLGELADQKLRKTSSDERGGSQLPSLGLMLAPATDVDGAGEKGLLVVRVEPNSKAAELGFQQGDVILKAGNRALSTPADLTAAMTEAKAAGRKNTLVMVKRDATDRYVAVPVVVG
jgi:serine protease Do